MVSIITMNVNSLKDFDKRKDVFTYCKKSKFEIVLMQETHCTREYQNIWKSQWGGQMYFSNGTNDERGVLIAINPKINIEAVSQRNDDEGRLLILNVNYNGKKLTIVNTCSK